MKLSTTILEANKKSCDCIIIGIYKKGILGEGAKQIDNSTKGYLTSLIKSGDISGDLGTHLLLKDIDKIKAKRILILGLGKKTSFDTASFRKTIQITANLIKKSKIINITSYLNLEELNDANSYYRARFTIETFVSSLYQFTIMKSDAKQKLSILKNITLATTSQKESKKVIIGAKHGLAISEGVNIAKDFGNLPPNVCTPSHLAKTAKKIGKNYQNLSVQVLNEPEIKKLGMHSFLSVTSGTTLPAKLIIMKYKGNKNDSPIVLIGKGITFDSGGISLKPGASMDEMKFDMSGAGSVIGTMATVAKLQLPINLNVIVPACENMPSGTATRPGDIIKSMSGQTIEVLNTDAEGRLILCDAITYSRRFKPNTVIDVATLTGACVVALGKHRAGIMSYNNNLAKEISFAGQAANDLGWRLPLGQEYEDQLKSNFADIANIGGRDAGASTAGCFLGKFAKDLNWAHLDIAGVAYNTGSSKGSTGRPVPMLSEFLLQRSKVTY